MNHLLIAISLLVGSLDLAALSASAQPSQYESNDRPTVNAISEQEREKPLAEIAGRIQKMLDLQIVISNETKRLSTDIEGTDDKRPRPKDREAALKLAEKQQVIVSEASKAIDLLAAEGSSVAFVNVFRLLREDMKSVQRRLAICDVGIGNQASEQEVIDNLQMMIEALKPK